MENYISCVINSINENLYICLDKIDVALNKCMHDYYEKQDDRDMLRDTMSLFDSVRSMVNTCLGCNMNDNQVSMMVEDLIAREIRLCEEIPYEKKTNNQLWQEYRAVMEDNMDKVLFSRVFEVRKVKHTIARYTSVFDTNYLEDKKNDDWWQEIALVYPQIFS